MVSKVLLTILFLVLDVLFFMVVKMYLTVKETNGEYHPRKFLGVIVGFSMMGLFLGDGLAILGLYRNLKSLEDDKWILDVLIILAAVILPMIRSLICKNKNKMTV